MSTWLILLAAFIGVSALVGGLLLWLRGSQNVEIEQRLDVLTGATSGRGKESSLAESVIADGLNDAPKWIERNVLRLFNVNLLLQQADSPLDFSKFSMLCGGLAFGGALLTVSLRGPLWAVPLAAFGLGSLPLLWIVFRRRRRLKAFAAQMPDALELMARALRSGNSLSAGLNMVAAEMADPIGTEFGRVFEAQNLGIPLEEAFESLTERVPNLDLKFFATAVILQRQTGGDLAEILDKIGYLIRERFKIWGQVQALTGEGRLSGVVLLGLPPVLFMAVYKLNPDYISVLFTDPLGKQMLAVAAAMQIVGALVIRKIVNIRV